jgi:DNA invertase Pin-like site-specific DNA recombinase
VKSAIAYMCVSTPRLGKSGLGLKARQATVGRFVEAEGYALVGTYEEIENGKGSDALERRPQLAAALNAARSRRRQSSSLSSIGSAATCISSRD